MPFTLTPRRLLYALVGLSFVAFNPIHLPFSLPWLGRQVAGSSLGDVLARYEGTILIVSTVYFMMVMTSFYIWLWGRRKARASAAAPREASRPAPREASRQAPPQEPYRGPGGGRRPPPSLRSRSRRPRRR